MVAFIAVAASLALAPAVAADDRAPGGAVGGLRNPAAGVLELSVVASDGGSGLSRAVAALDGVRVDEDAFGDGTCVEAPDDDAGANCPATGTVTLSVPTTQVPDGDHVLTVTVRDAAGNVATLEQR